VVGETAIGLAVSYSRALDMVSGRIERTQGFRKSQYLLGFSQHPIENVSHQISHCVSQKGAIAYLRSGGSVNGRTGPGLSGSGIGGSSGSGGYGSGFGVGIGSPISMSPHDEV
jgi:hypothetical protein